MMPEKESGLVHYTRPDGIRVYKALDFSQATLKEWKESVFSHLDQERGSSKSLYEMRHVKSLPIRALRTATDIQTHPNIHFNYSVALVSNDNVAKLVDTLAGMLSRSNVRVMSDETEAVRWLNDMVPPADTHE